MTGWQKPMRIIKASSCPGANHVVEFSALLRGEHPDSKQLEEIDIRGWTHYRAIEHRLDCVTAMDDLVCGVEMLRGQAEAGRDARVAVAEDDEVNFGWQTLQGEDWLSWCDFWYDCLR
jgi:hypothetical protein